MQIILTEIRILVRNFHFSSPCKPVATYAFTHACLYYLISLIFIVCAGGRRGGSEGMRAGCTPHAGLCMQAVPPMSYCTFSCFSLIFMYSAFVSDRRRKEGKRQKMSLDGDQNSDEPGKFHLRTYPPPGTKISRAIERLLHADPCLFGSLVIRRISFPLLLAMLLKGIK